MLAILSCFVNGRTNEAICCMGGGRVVVAIQQSFVWTHSLIDLLIWGRIFSVLKPKIQPLAPFSWSIRLSDCLSVCLSVNVSLLNAITKHRSHVVELGSNSLMSWGNFNIKMEETGPERPHIDNISVKRPQFIKHYHLNGYKNCTYTSMNIVQNHLPNVLPQFGSIYPNLTPIYIRYHFCLYLALSFI